MHAYIGQIAHVGHIRRRRQRRALLCVRLRTTATGTGGGGGGLATAVGRNAAALHGRQIVVVSGLQRAQVGDARHGIVAACGSREDAEANGGVQSTACAHEYS